MLYFAIAIFILFFLISRKNPLLALAAACALLPTYLLRFQIFGLPSTILEVMIWAIVFGWLTKLLITNYKLLITPIVFRLKLIKWPLAVFFLASIIAIFVSPDKIAALGVWRAYFLESILFFFLILAIVKNKEDFKKIIFGLSVSALYLSVYAIGQRFFGLPIPAPWQSELRVTSLFPYPNALGLYLAPLIPLFIYQIIINYQSSIIKKFSIFKPACRQAGFQFSNKELLAIGYWLLVIALSLLAIVLAKSDGAVIALLATGSLLMLANVFFRKKIQSDAILIILIFVAAGLLFTALAPVRDKILLRDWSGFVRTTIWSETLNMLKGNPVFGAGLAGYQTAILPYHESRDWMEIYLYPHNIILNFWSELGLLGLAAFIWLLERFGKMCYKLLLSERKSRTYIITALAAMAVLVTHGLVDVPYFKNDLSVLFWIIFSMPLIPNPKI